MSDLSVFAITDASSIVVKATVLLATAIVIQYLLRRRASAATRDVVLTLAAISVLVLPVASLVSPEWGLLRRQADLGQSEHFRPESDPAVAGSTVAGQNIIPASFSSSSGISDLSLAPWLPPPGGAYARALALVYAAGAGAVLLHLLLQRLRTRRFLRSTTVVEDPEWQELLASCVSSIGVKASVRLLRSREQNVPLAVGTRRPAIVIPAIASTWEHDRRQAVLLHELAHVARHDCLTGVIVAVSCAMYWFHPAMWWVARQLRIERELACDDRVIAAGAGGRDYAGHLLEIAYSTGGRGSFAFAVAMARRSQLEGRLLAAIDETRNRRVPALRVRLAAVAIGAAMLVAIAGARTTVVGQSNQVSAQASVEVSAPEDSRKQVVSVDPVRERLSLVSSRVASRLVRAGANVARNLQDNLPGTWEIRPTDTQGVVHLRLVEVNSQSGTNVQVAQLEGLTPAHLSGAGGPVQFRIRRDAGTFTFEGVFRGGVGAGTFSFAPDANFPAEMAKRGFSRPTASEQYQLARHDIGFAFVDELTRQGYGKPQTSELVQAGQHGVHLTYLRDMGALGYRLGTLQPLITLRDHGVTPEYVRQLAELGYKNLSADQVRNARDHGVTAEYVRGMRDAGYGSQTLDALINSRDHGVTPEYIRALDEAGYRKVPLEDVIRVRDHGVSPEYIRDMHQLGFKLPIDELVRARDHGVSVEYVRGIVALGYGNQPIDALIRLRDHGVTPEYAKEIKGLGYDGLTLDDLISLRDHGVTVERIKSANARAGTRLPIDMLRSLAAGGMR
jgi:beta-lactamase regulating signal transducer with metallopeptidase domain